MLQTNTLNGADIGLPHDPSNAIDGDLNAGVVFEHIRHCERSEAIQGKHGALRDSWIAASLRSSR